MCVIVRSERDRSTHALAPLIDPPECEYLLSESSGKSEVLETGYSVDRAKKKTKYVSSELRLIETMDGLCEKLLEYNIHKERKDVTRFARGTSETFQVKTRWTKAI